MEPKKIEEYKYFQPIAWVTVLVFAMFVFALSIQSRSTIKVMQINNAVIEERLQVLEEALNINNSNVVVEEAEINVPPENIQELVVEEEGNPEEVVTEEEVEEEIEEATAADAAVSGGVGAGF